MDTEEQSPRNKQHIVPTFPNISKRPSVYKLFQPQLIKDEDKVINDLKTLNTMIKELDQEKYGFLSKRTLKRSNERQTTLKSNKLSLLRESDTSRLLFPSINAQETTEVIKTISMSKNLTTNESSEIVDVNHNYLDDYYNKHEKGLYGKKDKDKNENYLTFDESNKEEYYYHNGISYNNFELKSHYLKNKTMNKRHFKMRQIKKIEFKLIENAHAQLMGKNKKKKYNKLFKEDTIDYKNSHYQKYCDEIIKTQKSVFTLTKKKEFAELLINNYIQSNLTDLHEGAKKNYRNIYVIKNSTILTNLKVINGIVAQIPLPKSLEKYTPHQRQTILKNFLLFCQDKFNSQIPFEYLYLNSGIVVNDLMDINTNIDFVYVCPTSLFEGLSIPLNKNVLKEYKKYFPDEDVTNGAFTDSSIEEENKNKDEVFHIYFDSIKNKKAFKTKQIKKKKINSSFTHGIEDNKEEFIYYSDTEERKKGFVMKNHKETKKIDYFITQQNNIYQDKISKLKLNLSNNKNPPSLLTQKNDIELTDAYLKQKHIPQKSMVKIEKENKTITTKELIDSLRIIKQKDKSINLAKFYIHSNKRKNLPKVTKNIIQNSNKYITNESKINKEYPHLLSYNVPKVLSKHPKYNRDELIALFAKFKTLVNLWLCKHETTKVDNYGIDFEVFHNCLKDMSQEEEILAKKIFDEINTRISGILSLEDFVDAMTILNRRQLKDQMEFFLRVFDSKNKGEFSFHEVETISKMSIKRLIKNYKNNKKENEIINDIANFFAGYIYRICECDTSKGLPIYKLQELINSNSKEMEYLEVFCCSYNNK